MNLESENKDIDSGPKKNFLDYIREIWKNLKNFISEFFSTNKKNEQELNNLKQDIKVNENNKNTEEESKKIAENTDNNKSESENINNSVEKDKKLFQKLKEICVRSKKYGDVNKNDCGFVSIGLLQFHGNKTGEILNNIKSIDPERYNSIMTDPLFKNSDKACKAKRNDTQANQYKKLMEDPKAQKEMDKAVDETIGGYIDKIKSWGVTDDKAILAFGRICNYGSGYSQNLCKKMKENGANINDYKQVIERFEKTEKSQGKTTTSQKFKKKSSGLGGKSVEEAIEEYSA